MHVNRMSLSGFVNLPSDKEESNNESILVAEWPFDIRYVEFCQYSYATIHNIQSDMHTNSDTNEKSTDTTFVQRNIIPGGYEWHDQEKKENVFHQLFVTKQ